jgi:hypothetical protein
MEMVGSCYSGRTWVLATAKHTTVRDWNAKSKVTVCSESRTREFSWVDVVEWVLSWLITSTLLLLLTNSTATTMLTSTQSTEVTTNQAAALPTYDYLVGIQAEKGNCSLASVALIMCDRSPLTRQRHKICAMLSAYLVECWWSKSASLCCNFHTNRLYTVTRRINTY